MHARFTVIMLALLLAPASAPPVTGSQLLQNVASVHENTPTPIECGLPQLKIGAQLVVSSDETVLTIVNDTAWTVTEFLIVDAIIEREPRQFWTEVKLEPNSTARFDVQFLVHPDRASFKVCKDHGHGIIEGNDPIMPVHIGIY